MNDKKMQIILDSKAIEYTLSFKRIKNVNMRIKNDGLHVSAPIGTNIGYIEHVLLSRQEAIVRYIEKLNCALPNEPFADGKKLMYLGSDYTLITVLSSRNNVTISGDCIIVSSKNSQSAQPTYEKWLNEVVQDVFTSSLSRMYPLLSANIKALPILQTKKLTASWGRCAPSVNRISLSLWLIKADESLIDYVMLHELCHYVHLNHSKEFYKLLKSFMPDYNQRKKLLNTIRIGP